MSEVTYNADQRLFVIPSGNGYSCLGYDVALERSQRMVAWLASKGVTLCDPLDVNPADPMTIYYRYQAIQESCRVQCERRKIRANYDLSPQLIGLEGKRVEVETMHGERYRFNVGRSTGWCPIHLEVLMRTAVGSGAACREYKSVRVV